MFLASFTFLLLGAFSLSVASDCEGPLSVSVYQGIQFCQTSIKPVLVEPTAFQNTLFHNQPRVYGSLTSAHRDLSPALVEEELLKACTVAQGKEGRLCYYVGASSDAATRVTSLVSRPLASHVPVEKICQRLGTTDTQICQLKYERQLWDLSSAGLNKMRVAELRKVLSSWGEECRGCLEKHELVSLIQQRAPLHIRTAQL